ncbi:MAG: hypothetical protein IPG59_21130 [Candidatus Melainabacteria bacterium]|nr:MAG: hypothetical protein IPG59_21130 [Candidatus Melainabacteria bacterium]
MNRTIFRTTLKMWCSSAGIISLCGLYFLCLLGYSVCNILFTEWQIVEPTFVNTFFLLPFIFALGTGIIGKDISSGVLSTVFSRPLARTKYVMAKWLALSVATSAIAIALALCEQAVVSVTFLNMPDVNLCSTIAERISLCFGLSATMVGLSSLFAGNKNMVVWCVLFGGMFVLTQLAQSLPSMYFGSYFSLAWMAQFTPIVKAIGEFTTSICLPWLDMTMVANALIPSAATILGYSFTVFLMLTIAIWRMNNLEVSYAQQQ